MVFGHLPFGYITGKILYARFKKYPISTHTFTLFAMSGAIAPDTDLLYYYLIDYFIIPSPHRHHEYFTHFPIFWLTLLLISTLWLLLGKNHSKYPALSFVVALGGFCHMILDTVTGSVFWLAPFLYTPFTFKTNHSGEMHYLTQWGFGLELCIIVWAIYLWYSSITTPSTVTTPSSVETTLAAQKLQNL